MLGAVHRLAKGRVGVTVGIHQLGKAAKVKPPAEVRRLADYLARLKFITFSRGRAALTETGLSNVLRSLRR